MQAGNRLQNFTLKSAPSGQTSTFDRNLRYQNFTVSAEVFVSKPINLKPLLDSDHF